MKIDIETKPVVSGHRIFLIDPDVINRSPLYFMISDANETYEFDSIADVADMNGRQVPDLVIVNASLVAKCGKALIQGWRSAWPQVKVLLICEACDNECIIAAKAAGADDTLQRPFKRDDVLRKVERWMERPVKIGNARQRHGASLHLLH